MNSLELRKKNMQDNITSMESLMTIMDCDLFVIEHILLCTGDCYYYDSKTNKIEQAFLFLDSSTVGDIKIFISIKGDNPRSFMANAEDCYFFVAKEEDELKEIVGDIN